MTIEDMTHLYCESNIDGLCEEFKVEDKYKKDYDANCAGEDSSYDSDYEGNEEPGHHDDVSRTVSDTLCAEFSEYVSVSQQPDSAYTSRVEFALKLGYTEKLVQAALQKLGPNPEQNELLAELIKLVDQKQTNSRLKYDSDGQEDINEQFLNDQLLIPLTTSTEGNKFRPIVIDGSNVAMSHGNKEVFSCRGIKICVDWFRARGHLEITVFVPKWRKESPRPDNLVTDQDILYELERERLLVFTPSREVRGKRMVCYDDRYILKLAAENDGIVVSNDNYRDLIPECPEFRKVVEERILMYSFVNDKFMPPDDPLGRAGPTLDNFLKGQLQRKADPCPYGKKCTYGNKCKYNHPERGLVPHKSVTERLLEHAQKQFQARNQEYNTGKKVKGKSLSLPLQSSTSAEEINQKLPVKKTLLSRTKSTSFANRSEMLDADKTLRGHIEPSLLDPSFFHLQSPNCSQASSIWSPTQTHSQWINPQMLTYNHPMAYRDQTALTKKRLEDSETKWNNPEFIPPGNQNMELAMRNPAVNLHRKLQRQLSINPTCDSRIYHMQKMLSQVDNHQNLTRHFSYQNPSTLTVPLHSNVTRISSAPPSNSLYTLPNPCNVASSSDSQLNILPPPHHPSYSSPRWQHPNPNFSADEARSKLHYHLASIFPEEQVDAAMRLYPNETNPQKICAAILTMFSNVRP